MQHKLKNQLMPFVMYASKQWPVNHEVIAELICDLVGDRPQLIKCNNLFAIAGPNKKFYSYSTPIHGIDAGMDLLTKNPQFIANKVGTLKANPKLQLAKIRTILGLPAKK
jgi:hypothetical protein